MKRPADIYAANSVYTMPPHIQLSQLHARGALLTKGIKADVEKGNYEDAREKITQVEDILTFLRSSLDLSLEVSRTTDGVYAFYYQTCVQWFLKPNAILEDEETFTSMISFWDSWAATWLKVTPKV